MKKEYGQMLKNFRKNILCLTLKEVSSITKIPISTLSTVENGGSTNVDFLSIYYRLAKTEKQKQVFNILLDELIKECL